jgi:radical SAM protein with 4Fe4S-binding SPASM domain
MFNRIYLEITNQCNMTCSFCPPHRRAARFLSQSELDHRMHHIAQHTKNVYFHVKGEPLLSPHLQAALDAAYRHQLDVHLVSNGLLIGRHGDLILNHPSVKTITLSLHSYSELDPIVVDKQIGIMQEWLSMQRPHHPHIRLRIWDADTGKHINSRHLIKRLTGYEIAENVRPNFRVSLQPNRHIQSDVRFDWPDLSQGERYPEGRCNAGMMLAVLADGTVTPCCLDGEGIIGLGNIEHTALSEIIASQRYRAFLQGMNDRKPSEALCRSCSFKQRFIQKEEIL